MTVGEWTIGALKEYFDRRFTDWEARIDDAKHSVERAEDQASATRQYTEQKNNEFRGQLADQAASFMPRTESDGRFNALQRQIDEVRGAMQKSIDELRRLVWIGVGLAIAASVAIPILLARH